MITQEVINSLKKSYMIWGNSLVDFELFEDNFLPIDGPKLFYTIEYLLNNEYIFGFDYGNFSVKSYDDSMYYRVSDKFVEEFMNDPI